MSYDGVDMAKAFGAEIDVTRPNGDENGFFMVKREPDVDHEEFFEWLVSVVGGADNLLFHHADGLFVVWTTFEVSRWLEDRRTVATVGGVTVDSEQFRSMLGPA